VDVWAAIEASGFEKAYAVILQAVLGDPGVDAAVVIAAAVDWAPDRDLPGRFADLTRRFGGKPVYAVSPPGDPDIYLALHRGFTARGIPHYRDEATAIAALAATRRYALVRERAGRPVGGSTLK
jgi:acyl-CoA synthetase (NDP forming)